MHIRGQVILMKTAYVPKRSQKTVADHMERGVSSLVAAKLVKLHEIELARREIVDGCKFSHDGRENAERKFRKYLESQLMK